MLLNFTLGYFSCRVIKIHLNCRRWASKFGISYGFSGGQWIFICSETGPWFWGLIGMAKVPINTFSHFVRLKKGILKYMYLTSDPVAWTTFIKIWQLNNLKAITLLKNLGGSSISKMFLINKPQTILINNNFNISNEMNLSNCYQLFDTHIRNIHRICLLAEISTPTCTCWPNI